MQGLQCSKSLHGMRCLLLFKIVTAQSTVEGKLQCVKIEHMRNEILEVCSAAFHCMVGGVRCR